MAQVEARRDVGHARAREIRPGHPGGVPRHGQPEAADHAEGVCEGGRVAVVADGDAAAEAAGQGEGGRRAAVGAAAKVPDFDRLNLSASRERTLSSGNDAEDPLLVGKYCTYYCIKQDMYSRCRRQVISMISFSFRISDGLPGG